ncbi:hypothetical protein GW17_00021387 [Ensete ventricosum]|nr:hypothetical protein GW17_00021387 [Ensete ventricosum]
MPGSALEFELDSLGVHSIVSAYTHDIVQVLIIVVASSLDRKGREDLQVKALSFRGFELPIGGHGGLGNGGRDRSRRGSEGPNPWISGAQVPRTDSLRETAPGSAVRILFGYKSRLDGEFMLRTKNPCGKVPNKLYLVMDDLADEFGIGTLRLTTRQTFQLHGIPKKDLKTVMSTIIKNMGSTLGACGDLNRNVLAPAAPFTKKEYVFAQETAENIATLLTPQSGAYYDLWVDGEKVMSAEPPEVVKARNDNSHGTNFPDLPEPIYGTQFLPRKFKIAVTVPKDNSVDILTNDIGVVLVSDYDGEPQGFNIYVKSFYAPVFVFNENVMIFWSISWQGDNAMFCGLNVDNGRIGGKMKKTLREVIERYNLNVRITPNQNLILCDIRRSLRRPITIALAQAGLLV